DPNGNTATATRTVNVVDTIRPVMTLIGSGVVTNECHSAYVDAGATASDNCAGDLTSSIAVTGGLNVNTLGSYTLRYNVGDPSGHAAVEITRTVQVVDTTKPVIHCPASQTIVATCGSPVTFTAPTATDNYDPSPTVVCVPASGSLLGP